MNLENYKAIVVIIIKHLRKKYTNLSVIEAFELAIKIADELTPFMTE